VVVVTHGYETKRLKYASRRFSQRVEHLCHALDVSGLGLNGNFDEIAFGECSLKLQQPPSQRKRLDFASGSLAVAQFNQGGGGLKLNASSTVGGVGLGIVRHAGFTMAPDRAAGEITEAQCPNSCVFRASSRDFYPFFYRFRPYPWEGLRQRFHQICGDQRMLAYVLACNVAGQAM
jgi:hypothetical protein